MRSRYSRIIRQSCSNLGDWPTLGTIAMQPPSAYHRQTFSIPSFPILNKRPSFPQLAGFSNNSAASSSSSPRRHVRPVSTSKILLSALAVTAARSWVLYRRGHAGEEVQTGGVGWLVLAFWGSRIGAQLRDEWRRRRKGKEKQKERLQTGKAEIKPVRRGVMIAKHVEG